MLNKEDILALAWEHSEGSGKRYTFTEESLFEFLKELKKDQAPAQNEQSQREKATLTELLLETLPILSKGHEHAFSSSLQDLVGRIEAALSQQDGNEVASLAQDEREAFGLWGRREGVALWPHPENPVRYYCGAAQKAWEAFQVGAEWQRNRPAQNVDAGLLGRIDAAIKAFTSGKASMHVPPEPTDVDMVLGECWQLVKGIIAAPQPEQSGLPDVCDGKEQEAFEEFARGKRMDMTTHPLHWLFLNEKTYAARQGWTAAIRYCRAALAAKEENKI